MQACSGTSTSVLTDDCNPDAGFCEMGAGERMRALQVQSETYLALRLSGLNHERAWYRP